jgi:hypothetical protein
VPMTSAGDETPLLLQARPMGDRILMGAFVFVTGLFLLTGAAALLALSLLDGFGPLSLVYTAGVLAAAALSATAASWVWYGTMQTARLTRALLDVWLMVQVVLVVFLLLGRDVGFMPLLGLLWFGAWRARMSRWLRRAQRSGRGAGVAS